MPSYETMIIMRPDVSEDQWGAFKTKLEKVIQSHEGQLANVDDWGVKRLSYNIKKQNRGRYCHFTYLGKPSLVADLERNLRINEQVMRFLSLQIDETENLETLKNFVSRPKRNPRPNMHQDDYFDEPTGNLH